MSPLFQDLLELLVNDREFVVTEADGAHRCRLEWHPGRADAWWLISAEGTERLESAGELLWLLKRTEEPATLARCIQAVRYRKLFPIGSSLGWHGYRPAAEERRAA